jgi:16S rRNA (uracil1498-N3)-methyltransferase
MRVRILEGSYEEEAKPEIWVAQATPKGRKFGIVLRWAVELEMQGVYFLKTARTVPRISKARMLERSRKVLISELKVSDSSWMPTVEGPGSIDELIGFSSRFKTKLLAWEKSIRSLSEVLSRPKVEVGSVVYVIGPEGGFSDQEAESLVSAGFLDVGLGRTRMRTESAQAYLGSILRYMLRGTLG